MVLTSEFDEGVFNIDILGVMETQVTLVGIDDERSAMIVYGCGKVHNIYGLEIFAIMTTD